MNFIYRSTAIWLYHVALHTRYWTMY